MQRLVVVVLVGCISPVIPIGSGKSARQAQHDTMTNMTPARLSVEGRWGGDVTTTRIRVWGDSQYRAQNVKWQKSFEEPLEIANNVLTPLFGLKLVADYQVWERHAPGSSLSDDIAALTEIDPGDGVFAVIGLTTSLPLVSATIDDLGNAALGGRHIMLRGYADLHERKLYEDVFRDLRAEERELSLDSRRRHKIAVVLLHELGHNLGFEHDDTIDTIMYASYSHRAGAFSSKARELLLREIDRRLGRASSQPDAEQSSTTASKPAKKSGGNHPPLVIRVTTDGTTVVDGNRLDTSALEALLKATFAEGEETQILINSDKKAPVGSVADVIDRAKAVGFTNFAMKRSGL